MKKTLEKLSEKKLIGITARTNNKLESDPSTQKIAPTIQKYFQESLSKKIHNKKAPGVTYCVYTEYESDFNGDYTYFIGEEVTSFDKVEEGFETLSLQGQNYAKFTNEPGPMPSVCIDMWQKIWSMDKSELGGERSYMTDFEVYDERSADHQNTVLDIYIGINK